MFLRQALLVVEVDILYVTSNEVPIVCRDSEMFRWLPELQFRLTLFGTAVVYITGIRMSIKVFPRAGKLDIYS